MHLDKLHKVINEIMHPWGFLEHFRVFYGNATSYRKVCDIGAANEFGIMFMCCMSYTKRNGK